MAGKLFINYRRGDEPGYTGWLRQLLQESFSPDQLFMDVDSIAPGLDFAQVIEDEVDRCDVFLAMIGPRWLSASDEAGKRRLDNPADFVRLEIESALKLGKRIIPVLVGHAEIPRLELLPESLKPLTRRNAVRLTHERFASDAKGLIKQLERALEDVESIRQADVAQKHRRMEVVKRAEEAAVKKIAESARREQVVHPDAGLRLKPSIIGRINRVTYWAGTIILAIISIVLGFVIGANFGASTFGAILIVLVTLALFYPGYAVAPKRFQDRDKPAITALCGLVPVRIASLLQAFGLTGTPQGRNRYGPDPLAIKAVARPDA